MPNIDRKKSIAYQVSRPGSQPSGMSDIDHATKRHHPLNPAVVNDRKARLGIKDQVVFGISRNVHGIPERRKSHPLFISSAKARVAEVKARDRAKRHLSEAEALALQAKPFSKTVGVHGGEAPDKSKGGIRKR